MNALKSWSTRRLREAQLLGPDTKPWSRHGSTRYLWNQDALEGACHYTEEDQGEVLALQVPEVLRFPTEPHGNVAVRIDSEKT